jgi:hypothetical protein
MKVPVWLRGSAAARARGAFLVLLVLLIVVHGLVPTRFALDWSSLFILGVAAALVLAPSLKSAKLFGGTEFRFSERIRMAELKADQLKVKVERRALEEEGKPLEGPHLAQPALINIPDELREIAVHEPPLAVAALRYEVERGLSASVRRLGRLGQSPDLDEMVEYLARHSHMWPEQVALLKVVIELSADMLLSGRVRTADAQRVIAIADTLNESVAIGYALDFEPNPDWEAQGRICEYEHCIENMPLPGIPRSEQEAWKSGRAKDLREGRYDDNPSLKAEMEHGIKEPIPEDAPEEVDRTGACPVFGHYCPGGQTTVDRCEAAKEWVAAARPDRGRRRRKQRKEKP